MVNRFWGILAASLLMSFHSIDVVGCTLAQHQWEEVFVLNFPLDAPLFPLGEIELISSELSPEEANRVIWRVDSPQAAVIGKALADLLLLWPSKLPWYFFQSGCASSSTQMNGFGEMEKLVVLSSDQVFWRVALFKDVNSFEGRCRQLVVAQESRARLLHKSGSKFTAKEVRLLIAGSWVFWALPTTKTTIAVSTFSHGSRRDLSENTELVEDLIERGFMRIRPSHVPEVSSRNLPF